MKKLTVVFWIFIYQLNAQGNYLDSLHRIINSNQHDSIKYSAFIYFEENFTANKPDTSLVILKQIIKRMEENLKNKKCKPAERTAYLRILANAYNNSGYIYHDFGNVNKAMDFYFKCLDIDEKLKDQAGLASDYNNIGYVYYYQNLKDKAVEYYKKSLGIAIKTGDKHHMALSYNNIGVTLKEQKKAKEALDYFDKALVLYKEENDKRGIGEILLNKANIEELNEKNFQSIANMLKESINLRREIKNYKGMTDGYFALGNNFFKFKDYTLAAIYADSCYKLAKKTGFTGPKKNAALLLYKIAKANKKYEVALDYYTQFTTLKDSMMNDETKRTTIQNEMRREFEVKQIGDSLKFVEETKVQEIVIASERKQKNGSFVLIGLMGFALVLGFFGYKKIKSANTIISSQKTIVEEKNKEILDSINYAKRLQSAILVTPDEIKSHFPKSFLLYKPKDIIAGDFYFMETVESGSKYPLIFLAAADSTGHGVPGAMVSVVCANAITRCVKEFGLRDPGAILDKARDLILETFSKSDKDVKDGMDISFCSMQYSDDKTNCKIVWAGANNPLWCFQNNDILMMAPDRQPVGKSDYSKPFTSHSLELKKGERLYLFTDGYTDQFGGPEGKKMKHKHFRELLMEFNTKSMDEQFAFLDTSFESWKGKLEQVDDVCVIGIEI